MGEQQRYFAYLVRLWTVRRDGGWVWHASVTDAQTREQRAFNDVAGLCAFLTATTKGEAQTAGSASMDDHAQAGGLDPGC